VTIVIVVAAVLVWALIGLVARVGLLRGGQHSMSWLTAVVLGPFVIPIVIENRRWRPTRPRRIIAEGAVGDGPIDVLVGVDPSPEAEGAAKQVVELLGERIGRLVVATVLPFDFADAAARQAAEHDARSLLEAIRDRIVRDADIGTAEPELVILHGAPAEAIVEHSTTGGIGLVAVGRRGHGISKAVIGSVAAQLTRDARVPVLVGDR
jgi:nucleotide-binding universal stress UspA family protein